MLTPILVTKSPKSIGIAILLTILFGPLGLLYATISGALIMLLAPILVLALFLIGVLQDNSALMNLSLGLLLFFALSYWLICIVWAVISVKEYNKNIEDENIRQFELWNSIYGKDQKEITINVNRESQKISISGQGAKENSKPSLQEWAKNNPGKSINDYYSKFGRN
jgi:hypothetical protein